MKTLKSQQVDEVVERLAVGLHPDKIYLYGSHAYGHPDTDSDIDVALVVPDTDVGLVSLYAEAEKCLRGLGLPVEIVIFTRSEFETHRHWVSSLPYTLARKGKLVYGR